MVKATEVNFDETSYNTIVFYIAYSDETRNETSNPKVFRRGILFPIIILEVYVIVKHAILRVYLS